MTISALLHLRRVHLVAMVDAFEQGDTNDAQAISRSLAIVNRKLAKHDIHPPAMPIGLLATPANSKKAKRRLRRAINLACEATSL